MGSSKAQITADFVVYQDSGCAPFLGVFSDSSKGAITYRKWDFGNGNLSVGNNSRPSATYNNSGVYDVTLTVSDGFDTATVTKLAVIHVFDNPVANFTHQAVVTGCASFPFQVNNSSTAGTIPIVSWEWDFDDGSLIDTGQSISHTYHSPGVYNVTLIVTDSLGCSSSKIKSNLVNVKPKPIASFNSNDSLSVCGPPLTITINNTTTSANPFTSNWVIGGTTYNSLNVNHTFNSSGGYDAQLIVTSTIGCKDTVFVPNYVWIGAIVADMDIPDTACLGVDAQFANASFGGTNFTWNFGDGNMATGDTVLHSYSSPGAYAVTLVSSSGSTCDDTTTQNIFVESVQANFSSTPHTACEVPMMVNFTDMTVGNIVDWEWRFGNLLGAPGKLRPNIGRGPTPINTYYEAGVYDDTLIVTTANGCIDTVIAPINEEIIITKANFSASVTSGCFPLSVDFTNTTDSVNRMANWWWNFDDGSPIDYSLNPTHVFNSVGEYLVNFSVVSIDGCTTSYETEIKVGAIQTASFTPDTYFSCASDSVGFINTSTDTSLINEYIWLFGDGTSDGEFEPKYLYQDTGYMDVTLIVLYNGCPDTLIIDSALRIGGPIVDFYPTYSCDSQNVVDFVPLVIGGTNWEWDFGDSSYIDSVNWMPTHQYPALDSNYVVSFTVRDSISGCEHSADDLARIRYLIGRVNASDTTACKNDNVIFSTGKSSNAIAYVRWSMDGFGNQKVDNSNTDYWMTQKGAHTVYAIVIDEHGCMDTASQSLYVYEPIIDFNYGPATACAPSLVQFTDLSTSDTNIVSWDWDFGNGKTSNLQNPSYVYNGNGTTQYNVVFTVTDTFGCSNQIDSINAITVIEPPSFFNSSTTEVCEFSDVSFIDQPTGSYTYFWDFGDGVTSNLLNPSHQYTFPGFYDVSLTVTDAMGCDSTYVRSSFIEVQDTPDADFNAYPSSTDCYPASILFVDQSTFQNVDFWTWNFGDSPNNVVLNSGGAQNLYNQPGAYDVTMIITTTFGCSDTITKYNMVNIGGPTGRANHLPEIGCVGQDVVFSADSLNNDSERFIWDYGDGVVDTTFLPGINAKHKYVNPGFYNVTVFISDLQGLCQITDTIDIEIDEVVSDFLITDTVSCTPLAFDVVNNSTGEDEIFWYLNGIPSGQLQTDSFFITDDGFHELLLVVKNNYSQCVDSSIVNVKVNPYPELTVTPDLTICIEDSIVLNVSGADDYNWTPNTFLSSDTVFNPVSIPTTNITYYVQGIDSNGCEGNDSVNISVQQKPELTWITPDTSIFVGADLQLTTTANTPILYSWTPGQSMGCTACPNPWVEPNDTTVYVLVYQDEFGCFVLDTSVTVNVMDEFKVSIPNTFTPGTDGLNDTFIPVIYGVEELMYMRIFNRWGAMVYETEDITQGWDGTYKGEIVAHNSAFSYLVKVKRYNGELKEYVGVVVVLTNGL
ncbi:MAG: PKD domain-containing protein [Salibacteraceae bacterium]